MNLDEIDKYCDLFEAELKQNPRTTPDEFCMKHRLASDGRLREELDRVAADYKRSITASQETAPFEDSARAGEIIGSYKLLQQIGEGGMGTVYMAEQETPVQRRVALKVIKPGMGSKEVIARFESERQALAMMDHENIAKMFDAGTTDDGRPFFVMELVRGVPLTKFCDDNKFSIKERLELFVTVCQAVQHAHQKGIIHRDIKPSNVLVSNYDGRPVPKIIDFGVAKAMQQKLTDKTLFTEFGRVIGTLQYMSPEQAGLSQLDIDTRSDIYSLGVLLYELLTGSTPIDKQRIREVGWERVIQLIREEEPPKPSTKISESGDALTDISTQRHSSPGFLGTLVRGELDWIVMKALEKDRSRRYDTANGFAMDVQRHLNDEPVSAGPPSASYRLRKFVRRNLTAVIAGSLVVLALLIALIGVTSGFVWALNERQIAKQRTQEAKSHFELAMQAIENYYTGISGDIHLKQPELRKLRTSLLSQARDFYQRLVEDLQGAETAEQRAELAHGMYVLARVTKLVGQTNDALDGYDGAISIYRDLIDENPDNDAHQHDLANCLTSLGALQQDTGELENASESFQSANEIWNRLVANGPFVAAYHEGLAGSLANLSTTRSRTGQVQNALDPLEESIQIYRMLVEREKDPEYSLSLLIANNQLGTLHNALGNRQPALECFQNAIRAGNELGLSNEDAKPDSKSRFANCYGNLALVQLATGKIPDACDSSLHSIQIYQSLAEEFRSIALYRDKLATGFGNHGNILGTSGEVDGGINFYRKAIDVYQQLTEDYEEVVKYHYGLAYSWVGLAKLEEQKRDLESASESYEKGIQEYRKLLESETGARVHRYKYDYADTCTRFGYILQLRGQFDKARDKYDEAIKILSKLVQDNEEVSKYLAGLAGAHNNLGILLFSTDGDLLKAQDSFNESLKYFTVLIEHDSSNLHAQISMSGTHVNIANVLKKRGNDSAALKHLNIAINELEQILKPNPGHPTASFNLRNAFSSRAGALMNLKRFKESASDWEKAADFASGSYKSSLVTAQALSLIQEGDHYHAVSLVESIAEHHSYNAACILSLSVPLAANDDTIDETLRDELAKEYGLRAVENLRQAIEVGYFDDASHIKDLKDDLDLDPIRDREDFQALMDQIESKNGSN